MGIEYFYDSYAVIEIIRGNPKFIHLSDRQVTITLFNLIEVVNCIYLDSGEEKAKETYERWRGCVQEIDWNIITEAIKLRQKYKKRDMSYADCIGYCYALQKGLQFLTGDKEFQDLPNVEFIKK